MIPKKKVPIRMILRQMALQRAVVKNPNRKKPVLKRTMPQKSPKDPRMGQQRMLEMKQKSPESRMAAWQMMTLARQ